MKDRDTTYLFITLVRREDDAPFLYLSWKVAVAGPGEDVPGLVDVVALHGVQPCRVAHPELLVQRTCCIENNSSFQWVMFKKKGERIICMHRLACFVHRIGK